MEMASARRAMLLIFLVCSALTTASNGLQRPADFGNAKYPPLSDEPNNDPQKLDPLYIPPGTYEVTHNDPYHHPDYEPVPSDSESDRSRFRRDSNGDFTTMIDRMEKISRVVNGISIEQGIINGTIKPDALISEFLNFGSLTLSDIEAINVDEVSKVVEEMQQLSKKLTKDEGTAKIESRFLLYESLLKKTEGIGQTLTIPEFNQYMEAVKRLMKFNHDQQKFLDSVRYLEYFSQALDSVDRDDKNNRIPTRHNLALFASSYLDVKNMEGFRTTLLKDEVLRNVQIFEPVDEVNQAVSMFQADTGVSMYGLVDDEPMTAIKENINALIALSATTKSSLSVLETLRRLFVTRHHIRGNRNLAQTPGYPNGISDFGLVFGDLKDAWIEGAVDGQSDALVKALDNLRDLKRDLQTSDGSFKLDGAEVTRLMTTNEEMIELSRFTGMFDDLVKSIENIKISGDSTKMQPGNKKEFQNLMLNILLLSNHLRALEVVVDVSGKLVADEGGHIKKLLEHVKDPTPETALSQLDKLRSDPEFEKIVELVRSAEKSIGLLVNTTESGNDTIIDMAKAVDKSSDQMQPYLSDLGGFLTKIDILRNVTGVDQVGEAVRTIQDYRNHTFKSSGFKKTSETLGKAKTLLAKLQKSVADMKRDTTPHSTALVELRDVFKDSQNVGAATRVFRSMQMVKEKKLVVMTPAMEKLIQDQLKQVSQKQQNQLNQLLGLDNELKNLIAAIGTIERSVNPSTSADLVSLWPIFSLASQAKGIPMDFLEISETIEELSKDPNLKSHQKDLLKIKNDLDSLDSLGLDYSKHQTAIKDTEESLKQLDMFFASYEKKVTPVVATVPTLMISPPPAAQGSNSGSGGKNYSAKHPPKDQNWVVYCLVGIIVGGGGGFLFWMIYGKLKARRVFLIIIKEDIFEVYLADIVSRVVRFAAQYGALFESKSKKSKKSKEGQKPEKEKKKFLYSDAFKLYFMALYEHNCKQTINEEPSRLVLDHQRYQRANEPLSEEGRLCLKKKMPWFDNVQYMHANMIKYTNNFKLALFQAPQMAKAATGAFETVGMFYWAMREQSATLVVCLAKIGIECCQYFPEKVGDKLTFTDGNLVVTCKSLEEEHDGKVLMRTLEVKFKGYRAFTIRHSHYDEWVDGILPADLSPLMSIFMKMDKEKVVFMHCDFGISRSGIMAQVLMNKTHLEMDHGRLAYGSAVNDVRKVRTGVIKNGEEFLQMAILTFKYFRTFFPDIKHFSDDTKEHIFFSELAIAQFLRRLVTVNLDIRILNEMNTKKAEYTKQLALENSKKEGKSEKKKEGKSEKKKEGKSEKKDGKKNEKKKSEKKEEKSKKKGSVKDVKESKPAVKDPKKNWARRKPKRPSSASNPLDDMLCELPYYAYDPNISKDFKDDIRKTAKAQKKIEKKLDQTQDEDEDALDEIDKTQEVVEDDEEPKEGKTQPKEEVKEKKKKKRKNRTLTESVEFDPEKEYPVGTRFKRLAEEVYIDDYLKDILK